MAKEKIQEDLPLKYMKETGRENFDDFCLDATRAIFAHVYYTWKTLKEALGPKEALEVYWKVWEGLAELSRKFVWKLVDLAGMTGKVDADQDLFLCRDGCTDVCRVFVRKKKEA